jgi:hypothetical protein
MEMSLPENVAPVKATAPPANVALPKETLPLLWAWVSFGRRTP